MVEVPSVLINIIIQKHKEEIMKPTTNVHYVYKITNLNPTDERLFYIGVRSTTKQTPAEDTKYMGSSKDLKLLVKELGYNNFKKEILSIWDTRTLAIQEEIRLHKVYDVAVNKSFYNKSKQTATGFDTTGKSFNIGVMTILDTRDGKTKQVKNEEYHAHDYYISVTQNKVVVLDTRDSTTKHVTVEEYNQEQHFVSLLQGKIAVLDTRDNKTKQITVEEYKKAAHYITLSKGKVSVLDTRDNKTKQVSVEDFYKCNGHYTAIAKGKMSVLDTRDNKTKRVDVDDYKKYEYYKCIMFGKVLVLDTRDSELHRPKGRCF